MKLIEILEINVKLIEEVESYSFFRCMNEKIYRLNYRPENCGYNHDLFVVRPWARGILKISSDQPPDTPPKIHREKVS